MAKAQKYNARETSGRRVMLPGRRQRTPVAPPNLPTHYNAMHPAHFAELDAIWEQDTRFPSVASRRTWAIARGLNPVQVNTWWHRRRQQLRRSCRNMASGTYELEVGVPPEIEIVIKQEVSEDDSEERSDAHLPEAGDDDDLTSGTSALARPHTRTRGIILRSGRVIKSDDTSDDDTSDATICGADAFSEKNCAYSRCSTQSSLDQPSKRVMLFPSSPMTMESTLPPSSPLTCPPSPLLPSYPSSSPCIESREPAEPSIAECRVGLACLDLLDSMSLGGCNTVPIIDISLANHAMFSLACLEDLSTLLGCTWNIPTADAPWCISGLRFAYDGAFTGLCLRCWMLGWVYA